jgi:tetratricopeptide (TPR) repeat protein
MNLPPPADAVKGQPQLRQALELHGAGRLDEAEGLYRAIVASPPAPFAALHGLGALLHLKGRSGEAMAFLTAAVRVSPTNAGAWSDLGVACAAAGRHAEAVTRYDQALALAPRQHHALNNRGGALAALGRSGDALASYDRALAIKPDFAEAHANRARLLRALGRADDALADCCRALALRPELVEALAIGAGALIDRGRFGDALAWLDRAIAASPGSADLRVDRACALIALGRWAEALSDCDRAIALAPERALAHDNRGVALAQLGRECEALTSFDRAIALAPDQAAAYFNKGVALLEFGRIAPAAAALQAAVRLAPRQARAFHALAVARRLAPGNPLVPMLERLVRPSSTLPAAERTYAHATLGKICDDAGEPARAFKHFAAAAALKRARTRYDERATLDELERTGEALAAALAARPLPTGDPSPLPVFVVGMPRSGTTLVEQILASHPEVHGAGEIRDFALAAADLGGPALAAASRADGVAQMSDADFGRLGARYVARLAALSPAAKRIVNKTPDNFRFVGLIALALPNARFVHVRRDPVDACFSCLSTQFATNLPYANDLAELGRYHRAYEALMAVWRRVLPSGAMLEVRYEDVVANLEDEARRIVAHCGLAWSPRCLDFHLTERRVSTASLAQVRRPLYASAVGRWRRYQAFLGPLLAALETDRMAAAA